MNSDVYKTAGKVRGLYDLITKEFIITNKGDVDIDGKYVSSVLLPIVTSVVKGKILIYGNPGNGKTTTSELVSSIVYGLPLDTVISYAELHGHPEITAEDIFGSLSLPEMKEMKWSPFSQFPETKIIDEINRLSGKQQDMILNLADRGVAKYLDNTLIGQKSALYATANYADSGNTDLILPLKDRFDVSIEMPQLNPLERILLTENSENRFSKLEDKDTSNKIKRVLYDADLSYENRMKKLEDIASEFKNKLRKEFGDDVIISRQELDEAAKYINEMPISEESKIFLVMLHSEIARPDGKERRSGERKQITGHYQNTEYAFNNLENDVSNRFTLSLVRYGKAYAWLEGSEEVEPKHLASMLPYTLAHREEFTGKGKIDESSGSNLDYAKAVSKEITNRYNSNPGLFKEAYQIFILATKSKDPEGEFERKLKGSPISDHPFIRTLERLLGK